MPEPRAHRTGQAWSPLQIRLHWLVAFLLISQWWSGDSMEGVVDSLEQQQDLTAVEFLVSSLHSYGGIAILGLVVARVWLRLRSVAEQTGLITQQVDLPVSQTIDQAAPETPATPRLLDYLAQAVHLSLYAVLILLAVTGTLSYYKILPAADLHERAGSVLIVLVLLHLLAALYHGWVRRDGVLDRMWPATWPRFW